MWFLCNAASSSPSPFKCEFHELSKLGQGKWSATHSWCQNTCSSSPIARGTAAVDTSSRLFRNSPSHAAVVVATPLSTTGVICKYLSNGFYKSLHCLHWNFCEKFPCNFYSSPLLGHPLWPALIDHDHKQFSNVVQAISFIFWPLIINIDVVVCLNYSSSSHHHLSSVWLLGLTAFSANFFFSASVCWVNCGFSQLRSLALCLRPVLQFLCRNAQACMRLKRISVQVLV